MSLTYKFHNLQSVADWLEDQAKGRRISAERHERDKVAGYKQRAISARTEAATLERVATMLRNTFLEDVRPK